MSLTDPNQSEDVAPETKAAIVDVDVVAIAHDEKEKETEQDMIASAMSGDKIKELLTADGPTVKAVLLKTDGTVQQISYDSTPSRNHVADILGAPPSIIGQYVDLDVILVGPRFTLSPDEFPLNTHTLRYPFNNEQFRGDVFLYRFSQQCVVEDFTLTEYEAFAANKHEDIGRVYQPPQPYVEPEAMDQTEEDVDAETEAFDTEAFMRQIIVKKVRAEFPAKFGREPSAEEVEAFVQATMQKAGAMFGGGGGAMDDIPEEAEHGDEEDYEPDVDADEAQREENEDVPSADQLESERCDIESAQAEEAAPRRDIDEKAEEAMVNSPHFEQEMRDALQSVEAVAKVDKAQILRMAREQYFADTGEQPTEDMLADALRVFSIDADEQGDGDEENDEAESMDEEESSVDAELFAREMAEALSNITRLGAAHQIEFVQKLSDTFCELNGGPPSAAQVSSIFGGIKQQLAEEAKDEFLELKADKAAEDRDDEEDEDYVPDEQDLAQAAKDAEEYEAEEEVEEEPTSNSRANSVKILVTPVKRAKSGSRVDIYLREQSEEKQNHALDLAASKFEQINGRAPDESDTQRLKEFISTGMLFETEMDGADEDEEADEDYSPEKDAFDYSQDAADEASYKAELSTAVEDAENQDTSNNQSAVVVDVD